MAAPRKHRKLAAVMAVDVVGYSRLVELDEAGTLARVKAHRVELVEPSLPTTTAAWSSSPAMASWSSSRAPSRPSAAL